MLILVGNGNGTFRPYRDADQTVTLAVADLTGNGANDFIYADQWLDRVVVYGSASQAVNTPRSWATSPPACCRPAPSCWPT